jgi:hypothetical protein
VSPKEFKDWMDLYESFEVAEDGGLGYWHERLCEVVNAKVAALERKPQTDNLSDAIAWAAFWVAVGSVLSVVACRLLP